MKRLEIIHLRSSGEPLESLGHRIRESLGTESTDSQVALYHRDGLATDVAVHLHYPETVKGDGPSRLGLRLASALRGLGLVNHTLWEELK